jgi:hypothetical protein
VTPKAQAIEAKLDNSKGEKISKMKSQKKRIRKIL